MKRIFIVLILAINLLGCKSVTLHPIQQTDIFSVSKGSKISGPEGEITWVEKDGWFVSDFYMKEIADAKVK